MKKNKISKNWLIKKNRDFYFKQSKIQGYRSRSAFKLIEMNKKFKFLKKNLSLLDLGSCPGGWSQVARKEIVKGKILAVDVIIAEKNIIGTLVGTWSELYELMELANKGLVKLSMQEYKLDQANKALHDLNNGQVKGRAVLVP